MALNDSRNTSIPNDRQHAIEVNEEDAEVSASCNMPSCSDETNTEITLEKFIKKLSYDEICLSIEIAQELQNALLDVDESKTSGACVETDGENKKEKESENLIPNAEHCLEYDESRLQGTNKFLKSKSENISGVSDNESPKKISPDIFPGSSNLNSDRTHSLEIPCTCNICGHEFSKSGHLKRHIRTHTGEKPFKCETCGVNFSRKDHLAIHTRKHTGEKPYKCDICGRKFRKNDHLKCHVRVHQRVR